MYQSRANNDELTGACVVALVMYAAHFPIIPYQGNQARTRCLLLLLLVSSLSSTTGSCCVVSLSGTVDSGVLEDSGLTSSQMHTPSTTQQIPDGLRVVAQIIFPAHNTLGSGSVAEVALQHSIITLFVLGQHSPRKPRALQCA
jgi:hypothetical protein